MRRAALIGILFFLATIASLVAEAPESPELTISQGSEVEPGGVLTVDLVSDAPLEQVTAVLLDGETVLADNHGSRVGKHEDGREEWVVLLGIASTIRPGEYALRLHSVPEGLAVGGTVTVSERSFAREEIPLSTTISELRRGQSAEKRQEALEMIALTRTFNDEAIYWVRDFVLPVESRRRTSGYGDRRRFLYADGGEARSIHNGIDLAADEGTPVYAPGSGRVVFAEMRIVTGNSVVIEHFPGVYGLFYI